MEDKVGGSKEEKMRWRKMKDVRPMQYLRILLQNGESMHTVTSKKIYVSSTPYIEEPLLCTLSPGQPDNLFSGV